MALTRRQLLQATGAAAGVCRGPAAWAQAESEIVVADAQIRLIVEPGFSAAQHSDMRSWVLRAAQAVSGYLGRFPVRRCELQIQRVEGSQVRGGTTFPEPEPWMRVRLGAAIAAEGLRDDWVLAHEMVHLAIPQLPRQHNWLHEGIATYVEGVARVRAGLNTAPRLWAELVRGLPQGQPAAGDRGLDRTPTWGRTYWGGALFCLLADTQMLERSAARVGLRQALQGLLAAGGHYGVAWPVRQVLRACDDAVGQTTLTQLYEAMKDSAEPVDLPGLWQRLGVVVAAAGAAPARFDDQAPLAGVRRAIAG